MQCVQAPKPYPQDRYTVFLSGSIAMGEAEMWQDEASRALEDLDILVLNPRRDDWDSTWKQSLTDPRFVEQVEWELDGLSVADAILMHFDPQTQSPITLLELGMVAPQQGVKRLYVSCPEGFWRKGNVEVVCRRFHIPLCDNLAEALALLRAEVLARGKGD